MYRVNMRPQHEREQSISQASPHDIYPFYEYQNQPRKLPIVRLDVSMPIYRTANYRTRVAQARYIHDNNKAEDFFSAGQENESVQQAQHGLLVEFAKQGRAESISPIYEELQSEEQREPLLITSSGVVVNGNRRLSAMRELYIKHPQDFRHFSHVDCAVLPSGVTRDEIREVEIRLQMRPETKLPYGWVNESLAIQELLDSGKRPEHIAELMKKRRKEIERAARALVEADIYLKDWLKAPGEYQLIEDSEQIFNDLAAAVGTKQGEELEISRRIAWVLIQNSRSLNHRRVYDYNFGFGKQADEVASSVAERLGVTVTEQPESIDQSDEFDVDFGSDAQESGLEPIIDIFDDPEMRKDVETTVIEVVESMLEQNRQGEIGRRALAAVQAANAKLQEVDLSRADPNTYQAINSQLDAVIDRITRLKTSLSHYLEDK